MPNYELTFSKPHVSYDDGCHYDDSRTDKFAFVARNPDKAKQRAHQFISKMNRALIRNRPAAIAKNMANTNVPSPVICVRTTKELVTFLYVRLEEVIPEIRKKI